MARFQWIRCPVFDLGMYSAAQLIIWLFCYVLSFSHGETNFSPTTLAFCLIKLVNIQKSSKVILSSIRLAFSAFQIGVAILDACSCLCSYHFGKPRIGAGLGALLLLQSVVSIKTTSELSFHTNTREIRKHLNFSTVVALYLSKYIHGSYLFLSDLNWNFLQS